MVWIADIERPPSMPLDQVHVALYGYFPQCAAAEERPYVWRLMSRDQLIVASGLRPSSDSAREVWPKLGITYDFRLTMRRTRNVRGKVIGPDGSMTDRKARTVTITDYDEIKDRVRRFAAERGGEVKFARVEGMRTYPVNKKVRMPICDVIGKVYVRDAVAFETVLRGGGPGTGKAYGLGMWYLPEIMGG